MEATKQNYKYTKYGYALGRVSTKSQAQVQHGSLEQQKNMIERWCKRQSEVSGYEYKVIHFIEEDISGRGESLDKRLGLKQIERAIRAGEIDFVVFEKLDRLSRNKIQNERFMAMASDNGVEVFEVESGRIDLRERGSRLGFNIKNMLAEEYSLDLEEKITKKQREARVNNGKDTSTVPTLGLDPHPTKTCMYVINKAEIKIVEDIMQKFCELKSYTALAQYCKAKGYKTKIRFTNEKIDRHGNRIPARQMGGVPLSARRLVDFLKNDKYRGYSRFKDDWNQFTDQQDENGFVKWEFAHGPAIDPNLFERVQQVAEEIGGNHRLRAGRNGTYYLLSGILFANDGSSFIGESAKNHQYYFNKTHKLRIRRDDLEKLVIDRVKQYIHDSDELQKLVSTLHKHQLVGINSIDSELTKLESQIAEYEKIIEKFSTTLKQAALADGNNLADVCKTILDERKKVKAEMDNLYSQKHQYLEQKEKLKSKFSQKDLEKYFSKIMANFETS